MFGILPWKGFKVRPEADVITEKQFDYLYGWAKKNAQVKSKQDGELTPTLIESIYGEATLMFDKQKKLFDKVSLAEQWARDNGIAVVIRHKAGMIIGDNMEGRGREVA